MKLRIIVTFKADLKRGAIDEILNHKVGYESNGSVVHMRGSLPWLDLVVDSKYIENFIFDFIDIAEEIKIVN